MKSSVRRAVLSAALVLLSFPLTLSRAVTQDSFKLNPDFNCYRLMSWQEYTGPCNEIVTMNPVNLDAGTRIFWNERDITEEKVLRRDWIDEDGQASWICGWPYIPNGGKQEPNDGFGIGILNPVSLTAEDEMTPETQITFLWTIPTSIPYPTFACGDKTVKSIAFTGLPDDALVSVAPDGIVLQFRTPGQYEVTYCVTDSEGLTRNYPNKYMFDIKSSAPAV